jgi:CheY-like chemotaxis protein
VKRVNLLLGNSEELVNDLIEATVQEVCAGRAEVNCTRAAQMEDFIQRGREASFDLIILIPNNLADGAERDPACSPVGKGVQAIQAIKSHAPTPVIALPVFESRTTEEPLMLGAGADRVLELPFDRNELKVAVSRLLKLPVQNPVLAPHRPLAAA